MSTKRKSIQAKVAKKRGHRLRLRDYIRFKRRERMILYHVYCMQGGFEEFSGSNLRETRSFR